MAIQGIAMFFAGVIMGSMLAFMVIALTKGTDKYEWTEEDEEYFRDVYSPDREEDDGR